MKNECIFVWYLLMLLFYFLLVGFNFEKDREVFYVVVVFVIEEEERGCW